MVATPWIARALQIKRWLHHLTSSTRKPPGKNRVGRLILERPPLIGGSVMLASRDAGSCRRAARDDGR